MQKLTKIMIFSVLFAIFFSSSGGVFFSNVKIDRLADASSLMPSTQDWYTPVCPRHHCRRKKLPQQKGINTHTHTHIHTDTNTNTEVI